MDPLLIAAIAAVPSALIAATIQELRLRTSLSRNRENTAAEAAQAQQTAHESELKYTQTIARLEGEIKQHADVQTIMDAAKLQMGESFQAAAATALKTSSENFLTIAQQNLGKTLETAKGEFQLRHEQFELMIKPLAENYNKLDPRLEQLSKYSTEVATAADRLANALQDNRQIGTWGEIQLRRIIEMAGMADYCDFTEQSTTAQGADRPDLTVRLPESRTVVIDAKASTKAYLEAREAPNEKASSEALARHAMAMKSQVDDLASKKYGEKVEGSLDFVILFVPGDQFLSAALSANPALVEYALTKRVAIATPASLVSLLWAIANGWQRYRIAEEAQTVLEIGAEMHKRLQTFMSHYDAVGKRLASAADAFNSSVQSFDSRVMPQARRFTALMTNDEDATKLPPPIEKTLNSSRYAEPVTDPE